MGFPSRNLTRFSKKRSKKDPLRTSKRRETVNTVKYAQSLLHNKGLLSETQSHLKEGNSYPIHLQPFCLTLEKHIISKAYGFKEIKQKLSAKKGSRRQGGKKAVH